MYHTLSIDQLSKKQVSKLLNGHPVRVKMGSGGKIHVTADQAKKMHRAGLKGCAITLTLDPYAIEHNQHLRDAVGMLRKLGVLKGGTALIDQQFTTREAVNTTGNFIKNPAKTFGFGFEGPLPSPDRGRVPPIPTQYRGRGYRKGLPAKYKGDGFWEDLGSVAKHVGKTAAKAISNEVVQYAGPAAGAAFAAAATASGNPEFAPTAAILGHQLGTQAGQYANKRIQGMGHRRKRGGTALIDQQFTTRQAVNTTGNFIKDPAKTLGFGGKGFVSDLANFGNKLKPALTVMRPSYMDIPEVAQLGDKVARSLGLGLKKGKKRVMSEAQKAALAKGRHALRIKLNEMGAGAKKKKSGKALVPAGYTVSTI